MFLDFYLCTVIELLLVLENDAQNAKNVQFSNTKKLFSAFFVKTITFKSNIFIRNDVREPN